MFEFKDSIINLIWDNLPHSLSRYRDYPGIVERIEIAVDNFFVLAFLIPAIVLAYRLIPVQYRQKYFQIIIGILLFLPATTRLLYGYAYDTPIALICQIIDFGILLYIFYKVGEKINNSESSNFLNISIGIAFLILIVLSAVLFNINALIPIPYPIINLVITGGILFVIWKHIPISIPNKENLKAIGFSSVFFALPFLPYLFGPAPPDVDITSMTEMIGYLFQGQRFSHIISGVGEEWYSIRYPAGFSALGWLNAHLLNIRASESVLLLWFIAFFIFLGNLVVLAKKLNDETNKYLILLFSLNLAVTGIYGLHGGQVQEMLAYALGVSMLSLLLEDKFNQSAICLGAGIVISPIITLPFCIVFGFFSAWLIIKRDFQISYWVGIIILVMVIGYTLMLGTGKSLLPSLPQLILSEITFEAFVKSIWKYLQEDTQGLYFFLFSFLIAIIFYPKRYFSYLLIIVWLLGTIFIIGIFEDYKLGRILGGFNLVEIWVLSVSVSYHLLKKLVPHKIGIVVLVLFVMLWIVKLSPGFKPLPAAVWTTHSDIKMGRYIESHLSQDILIANVRQPPSTNWESSHSMAYMLADFRGNSARNTVFARIQKSHHIKYGSLVDREPFIKCIETIPDKIPECLASLGVTHLVIGARPGTDNFVKAIGTPPMKQIGQTYLFDIK